MQFKDSDISIILNDKEYKVHKIMLRKLPYFDTMFDNFKEGNDKVIVLDNVDVRCWEKFLKTMYSYKGIVLYDGNMDIFSLTTLDEEYIEFCNSMGLKDEIDDLNRNILMRMKVCDYILCGDVSLIDYIMKNRELRINLLSYFDSPAYNTRDQPNRDKCQTIKKLFQVDISSLKDKNISIINGHPLFLYYGVCFMTYHDFEFDIKKINFDVFEGYNKYFKDEIQILCKLYKEDKKNKYDLDMLILYYRDEPTEDIAYYVKENLGSNIMKNEKLVMNVIKMFPDILGEYLDELKSLYEFEMHRKTLRDVELPSCPIFENMKLRIGDNERYWFKNNECIGEYKKDKIDRNDIYYCLIYYALSNTNDYHKIICNSELPKNTILFRKSGLAFCEKKMKEYTYGQLINMGHPARVEVKVRGDEIYLEYF